MKASGTFAVLFLLYRTVCASGSAVNDVFEEWSRYRNECLHRLTTEPRPKGVACSRMFDRYACWSDGRPNSTVREPCPWYLPWHKQVRGSFVSRECGADGQWATSNSSRTWRDHSQCEDNSRWDAEEKQMRILGYFTVMYTAGYCVSLVSLSLALVILLFFKKLHCTRNYIHTNLFASFILRAASILSRDALLSRDTPDFRDSRDVPKVLSDQVSKVAPGCRAAQVLMQYCVVANYYWLLVEGLYLHKLVLMAFSESCCFSGYLLIGWGAPVLFVLPWIIVRYLFENTRCWEINENAAHWWIIRTPILFAILVNFCIFIRIIHILVSKLKAHQMRCNDFKFRLAKSTLTLIPLLGIHEVLFAVLTEEHTNGLLRNVSLFLQLFINSFQGLLVAVLYCFVNNEVQTEVKKRWHRWKLTMADLDGRRNDGTAGAQLCASVQPVPPLVSLLSVGLLPGGPPPQHHTLPVSSSSLPAPACSPCSPDARSIRG